MEVTVYTRLGCVQCRATTNLLDRRGIKYEMVDVSDSAGWQQALRECGFSQMPVVQVTDDEDCQFWEGFRPDMIKQL